MGKEWRLRFPLPEKSETRNDLLQPIIARILSSRDIADVEQFLRPDYHRDTHDPFLFDDMEKAIARIIMAWETGERITVYGDYDADGLCSAALLYDFFFLMKMNVGIAINHREKEGYGLYMQTIDRLADEGTKLIITTDSGIANFAEIARAQERGVDVIITDHHTVPDSPDRIPPAYAIIHPLVRAEKYPFKLLSGGGVAFKLLQGLLRYSAHPAFSQTREKMKSDDGELITWGAYEKWSLDLVAISTIADCMPLVGENRVFVKFGLVVLGKTRRPGLRSILKRVSARTRTLNPETISFYIAPRLNAASRMDHAYIAFKLLTTKDNAEAEILAETLEQKNVERQRLTERVLDEARHVLERKLDEGKKVLIGMSSDWPLGILGLVAGKLCSQYNRPVVLMTEGHGTIAGAARSIESFNITKAFAEVQHVFLRFGGHSAAGGFALKGPEQVNEFFESFEAVAERSLNADNLLEQPLHVDAIATFPDVTLSLCEILSQMEPFGRGNPKPFFQINNLEVHDARYVGSGEKHVKFILRENATLRPVIAFSKGALMREYKAGDKVDLVCEIEQNEWNGTVEPQMKLHTMRLSLTV